jgi:phosphoglucomutase
MNLSTEIQSKVQTWLSGNYDEATKASLQQLLDDNNETELNDAFYRNLEFGTGGLRGIMGVGTNRMNKYTIGMATQGLANYLKKSFPNQPLSVAIAHDSRNNSDVFANVVADVFSANDITVYLFEALRPTPELSFAIRHLDCQSGVVLTASHNPKEYNGYKAYWNDGAQMIAPHDKNTIAEVEAITSIDDVKMNRQADKVILIGKEVDEAYMEHVLKESISKEAIARQWDLKIVYTPIHGTGITLIPELLKRFGFLNVHVVAEQATPDGNFPTVIYPNPEEAEALSMGVAQAKELDADLLIGTDPDADRVGIAAKNRKGEWQLLNGNQTATLLFYYMINAWKEAGKLDGKQFIVKTIVTTDLLTKMAEGLGVKSYETLTGFKYIAGVIRELEGKEQFIVGGEESYGYLIGDFVRDKDAISSAAMIAEMTAYAKDKGQSLFDMLVQIYQQFGFYKEGLLSLTKKGQAGVQEIAAMMENLRANPPKSFNGSPVVSMIDYHSLMATDMTTGVKTAIDFDKSNVLTFLAADGTKMSARPSGTEPKIKFYFSLNEPLTSADKFEVTEAVLDAKIKSLIAELGLK